MRLNRGWPMQSAIAQPSRDFKPQFPAASAAAPHAVAFGIGRVPPTVLLLLAIIFVQLGAALATVLFSTIGATGTAFASTFFSAAAVTMLAGFGGTRADGS